MQVLSDGAALCRRSVVMWEVVRTDKIVLGQDWDVHFESGVYLKCAIDGQTYE